LQENTNQKAIKESVRDIVNTLPNAVCVLIKGAKHNYPWVMYNEFNKIVEVWISKRKIMPDEVVIQLLVPEFRF
jgi:hypothetical protein